MNIHALRSPFLTLFTLVPALTTALTTSTNCPNPSTCFSLSVPDTTISSGTGPIELSISGPTTNSWISVAQGRDMAGANYFVIYTSADGTNVTISPRSADGEVMPEYSSEAQIEVLAGTGVQNGIMTANFRCLSCNSWNSGSSTMAFTQSSPRTTWIWASYTGSPLNTDSLSASIREHNAYGRLTFDISSNNIVTSNSSSSSNSNTILLAHAILACLAWTLLFPLGGIFIRILSFPGLIWVHAGLQSLGYFTYIAAAGLGIYMCTKVDHAHGIIGLVLLGLFAVQGASGWMHHRVFKKIGQRNVFSYAHLWVGRGGITLGMVNAGLGFRLKGKGFSNWEVVAYTVCAVVMWVVYVGAVVFGESRRSWKKVMIDGEKRLGSGSGSESEQGNASDGETPLKTRGERQREMLGL